MKKKLLVLSSLLSLTLVGCDVNISVNSDSNAPSTEQSQSNNEAVSNDTNSEAGENSTSNEASVSQSDSAITDPVDYTGEFARPLSEFDNSKKLFTQATVRNYVDGDTTHFNVTDSAFEKGYLSARYNGVDTPESTGQVEPWGKAASNFTKEKLSTAKSIIIESEDTKWNVDSNGDRYLLWIWYQPEENGSYRLLNLELIQEGLSIAKNLGTFSYAPQMQQAYYQAQALKLKVNDPKAKDPDFYYGDAIVVTMRELRENVEDYNLKVVRVEGVVKVDAGDTFYAESYDDETGQYYGFQIYAGYDHYEFLKVGNRVSICGTITYYEAAGTYQISGLHYYPMRPTHKDNLYLLEEGIEVKPTVITAEQIKAEYCATYVKLEDLKVTKAYTTSDQSSSSYGAMTLTCQDSDGNKVTVRTSVLYEEDGTTKVTQDAYEGQTIDVVGIVDSYSGDYQIHVFNTPDIIVK